MTYKLLDRFSETHLILDCTDWTIVFSTWGENLHPVLDQWRLTVDIVRLSFDQLSEYDLTVSHVHCRIVFADVHVHLDWLFLQERYVEVINPILEAELSLIGRFKSFTHLCRLSRMVVEVYSDQSYKRSVLVVANELLQRWDRADYIGEELTVFHLEV